LGISVVHGDPQLAVPVWVLIDVLLAIENTLEAAAFLNVRGPDSAAQAVGVAPDDRSDKFLASMALSEFLTEPSPGNSSHSRPPERRKGSHLVFRFNQSQRATIGRSTFQIGENVRSVQNVEGVSHV
jgi:hypothetical protein